jgi:hypothetical protein
MRPRGRPQGGAGTRLAQFPLDGIEMADLAQDPARHGRGLVPCLVELASDNRYDEELNIKI